MVEAQRIVVGIDFGTTSTSVAWAGTSPPIHIELIRNWPTCGPPVGTYVPTEISYQDGASARLTWGYNIQPRSSKIQWFKLGLETDKEVLSLPPGMTTADVVCDFLAAVRDHVVDTLSRRFEKSVFKACDLDYKLTVPAIWSDAAKQKTLDAAIKAGFDRDSIELLSEPECAAIHTLRNLKDAQARVEVDDRILVCDAGGGTVDIIAYDVVQIYPRLSVRESAAGTGEFCGSTFIDREFEMFFKARMGAAYDTISKPNKQQIAKNFEQVKLAFRDNAEQLLFYIPIPGITDLKTARIVDGNLEVTREEIRSLFQPIVQQVLKLLRDQVLRASNGSQGVSSILLVGGFGESEYLFQQIQSWASPYNIRVVQPRDAQTAIAQGAVIKGLETDTEYQTEVVRRARRSYGFPTSERFIDGFHSPEDLYVDPHTGDRLAKNQISWFIKKNQILPDTEIFRHRFARDFKFPTLWSHTVVSCSLEEPPRRLGPFVEPHCTIYSDLGHLKKQFKRRWRRLQTYYSAEYALVMGVRNNNLTVFLEFQGQRYGVQDITFD